MKPRAGMVLCLALAGACATGPAPEVAGPPPLPRTVEPDPREVHFGPLRMLTDGGENAEAYFSYDGRRLVFQSTRPPYACDQIFSMGVDGGDLRLESTGRGRTTCAYYLPGDRRILYASTHRGNQACPPPADMSQGYVWALYPDYDLFVAGRGGENPQPLAPAPGYDAEATISPHGDRIVFTSLRDGDLELYSMKLDGTDVRRLTHREGYDGGAFFSPDGSRIVYRAHHPETPEQLADYRRLLAQGLIRPSRLEIWVMNADGTDQRQVTHLGAASFAPFFHPSGKQILFSTNHPDPRSREFDLYLVNLDGTGLERVTWSEGFDGFPMFSPDGRWLVFCSNRHNRLPGETNIFITPWKD